MYMSILPQLYKIYVFVNAASNVSYMFFFFFFFFFFFLFMFDFTCFIYRGLLGRMAFGLAFRCARFCSASLIVFASYSPAPLFMRPRHFVRSCAICSHDSVGMWKSLREALRCPCIASSDYHGSVFLLEVLHRGFSLANVHQVFW